MSTDDEASPVEVPVGRERMKAIVASLQKYMASYTDQPMYDTYRDETFIDDVLYGLGVALDQEGHKYAGGFEVFKMKLLKHLRPNAD